MKTLIFSLLYISLLCSGMNAFGKPLPYETEQFKNYWYSGKAEITSYKLEQARYGEKHDGYAVLIFVTEDFSRSKQVKLDNPAANKDDSVKILKLNLVKKFNTGVYRYSIMESIFTPVKYESYPNTLKMTSSSQEWCGNTFSQLNLGTNGYNVQSLSYFETDGDRQYLIEKTFLEDEIYTKARLNPERLPVGKISIIPSLIFSRLKHQEIKPVKAEASLVKLNKDETKYSVTYGKGEREVTVVFSGEFPHTINSWTESYKSGFGPGSKQLVTKATRHRSIKLDYWNKNTPLDENLRSKLGIE